MAALQVDALCHTVDGSATKVQNMNGTPYANKACTLQDELKDISSGLAGVVTAIALASRQVSEALSSASTFEHIGSQNVFGESQLKADVQADSIVFECLRQCPSVSVASSEETPEMVSLGGSGFSVSFDPLDGSSIVGANFAVGTIFGVWPTETLLGCRGKDQAAAAYSIYGPRTLLVIAMPKPDGQSGHVVKEFRLVGEDWLLQRSSVSLKDVPPRICAPGNIKAASDNEEYANLINKWVRSGFSLRYSGGMAPDVHHILAKGGGVFCYLTSSSCPAKLRLLYEAAPLAFIIEAAGGLSHDGKGSILEQVVTVAGQKTKVCLGSIPLVEMCIPALQQ